MRFPQGKLVGEIKHRGIAKAKAKLIKVLGSIKISTSIHSIEYKMLGVFKSIFNQGPHVGA